MTYLNQLELCEKLRSSEAWKKLRDAPGNEGPHSVGVWTLKKICLESAMKIYLIRAKRDICKVTGNVSRFSSDGVRKKQKDFFEIPKLLTWVRTNSTVYSSDEFIVLSKSIYFNLFVL